VNWTAPAGAPGPETNNSARSARAEVIEEYAEFVGRGDVDGVILSGRRLFLSDGTPLGVKAPGLGNVSTFSTNSHGLVASADGKHFCFGDHGFFGPASPLGLGTCSAISPDGTRLFVGGQVVLEQDDMPGSIKVLGGLPPATGGMVLTPGTTLYTAESDGSMVYAYNTATNLLYDVVHVCKNPQMLGIQPMTSVTK
jgi:DNA-binding beta-propeller fold protein YncE